MISRIIMNLSIFAFVLLSVITVNAQSNRHTDVNGVSMSVVDVLAESRIDSDQMLMSDIDNSTLPKYKPGIITEDNHSASGILITKNFTPNINGLYWYGSAQSTMTLTPITPYGQNDEVFYGPVGKPYGNECIEQISLHYRVMMPLEPTTHNKSGFWNHCTDSAYPYGWITSSIEDMTNTLWRGKYLRTLAPPEGGIAVEVYVPMIESISANCARGKLYNFTAGTWDIKTPTICGITGPDPNGDGWLMWENYGVMEQTDGLCNTVIPSIQINQMYIQGNSGTWPNLQKSHTDNTWPEYGYCFTHGDYHKQWLFPTGTDWRWVMYTPAAKITITDLTTGTVNPSTLIVGHNYKFVALSIGKPLAHGTLNTGHADNANTHWADYSYSGAGIAGATIVCTADPVSFQDITCNANNGTINGLLSITWTGSLVSAPGSDFATYTGVTANTLYGYQLYNSTHDYN